MNALKSEQTADYQVWLANSRDIPTPGMPGQISIQGMLLTFLCKKGSTLQEDLQRIAAAPLPESALAPDAHEYFGVAPDELLTWCPHRSAPLSLSAMVPALRSMAKMQHQRHQV